MRSATITGSTLSNSTAFQGGAIANDLIATLVLLNSTIADNFAGQNGGGINQVGILTAYSSTIAYNAVAPGGAGGGIDASSGTTLLYNTIVADNTTGTGTTATTSDVSGTLDAASSNNLIGGQDERTDQRRQRKHLVGVTKPLLGTLAEQRRPDPDDRALDGKPGDRRGCLELCESPRARSPHRRLDQRGALRGPGGLNAGTTVDIGAFEASFVLPGFILRPMTRGVGTLRAAVGWADVEP